MENTSETTHIINPYVSVDCVLFGYDGENLNVLLVKQTGTAQDLAPHSHEESTETNPEDSDKESTMKLPGSLIYNDEDLDQAAQRVLLELTGLHNIPMHQFHSFGSKDRTNNPRDTKWLQRFHQLNSHIERIVTIGYFTVLKMSPRIRTLSHRYEACWVPLNSVGNLAFDHNRIIKHAMEYLYTYIESNPDTLFGLLPRKFTAKELRHLFEIFYRKEYDVRNFHKKIAKMPYILPLDEMQENVPHRAARYFRFDRVCYNQYRKLE